jgi:hypothetical protein
MDHDISTAIKRGTVEVSVAGGKDRNRTGSCRTEFR